MYEYILVLKGTNKDLACYEFETLWKDYLSEDIKLKQIKNIFYGFTSKKLIKSDNKLLKRLTFTNKLALVKHEGSFDSFKEKFNEFGLEKYDGKKFGVKTQRISKDFKTKWSSKTLAEPIYDSYKKPKIDLKNPEIEFIFFFKSPTKFYFTIRLYENDKDYLRRMPKLRPVAMPYTLKSDMARASINLLGLKKGIVLDPFCGIGGILLEAYDMNFEIIGNDISWNDLKYFKENFAHFYPDANYTRILADSKTQFLKKNTIDGIVTDIPYGKCSRKLGTELYEEFLKSSKVYLKDGARMIVIYANFVEFKDIALKYFNEVVEIDQYINRSMTRHILVLKNNK